MKIKKTTKKILFIFGIVAIAVQCFTLFSFKPKDQDFGLQLYSVRDAMNKDVQGTIAKVGAMGYDFVEAASFSDGKFYGMEPLAFKKLCQDNGLQFLGSHAGQDLPTPEKWDETMVWWDRCIDAHKAAGVIWIVQPSMSEEGYNSLEGLKKYAEYFNAIGEKCKEKGILFGYHNHEKEFTTVFDGKPLYDHLLELTDPDKVMFELDLYWITYGGKEPVAYFNKYPERFMLLHIKDKKELGASGKMNFNAIFDNAQNSGMKYGIVEVEEYDFDPLVSIEKSLNYLKTTSFKK